MESLVEEKEINKVIKFNLDANKKQKQFFNEVMKSVEGKSNKGYFFYGGAIRGGKTSVGLLTLHYLAREYPGFRAHVIRSSNSNLDSVINSFRFLFENSEAIRNIPDDKSRVNRYTDYKNGSRIWFISENGSNDSSFIKGLETNVIMLDQMEELREVTFRKAIQRVGSRIIPNITNRLPIILGNFNHINNWVKTEIYDKYKNDTLSEEYCYIESLSTDNNSLYDVVNIAIIDGKELIL